MSAAPPAPTCVAVPASPTAARPPPRRHREEQRERQRAADPERGQKKEEGDRADQPAGGDERPRFGGTTKGRRARIQPAASAKAQNQAARGETREGCDDQRGCDTADSDQGKAGPDADPDAWKHRARERQRRQRNAVDEAEHDNEGQS